MLAWQLTTPFLPSEPTDHSANSGHAILSLVIPACHEHVNYHSGIQVWFQGFQRALTLSLVRYLLSGGPLSSYTILWYCHQSG